MTKREPISKMTPKADEDEASMRLATQIAPRIDELIVRQQTPDNVVISGSPLDADDKHAAPYQVSHAAWHLISHAIDNLQAIRMLTVRGADPKYEVFTLPYALYPLIRCAFENASQALWLIGPTNRNERITRRFRLWITDGDNVDTFAGLAGIDLPVKAKTERIEKIQPLAESRGLDMTECVKSAGNAGFIRGAATLMGGEPKKAEALWRSLSGLSHGDFWASNATTDRDEVAVSEDGRTVTLQTTSSITNITNLTAVAVSATEAAVRCYDRGRTKHT
ncbi:MAG: hypothetical protein ACXVXO_03020 [Mycobacteriaceae bacterium]